MGLVRNDNHGPGRERRGEGLIKTCDSESCVSDRFLGPFAREPQLDVKLRFNANAMRQQATCWD